LRQQRGDAPAALDLIRRAIALAPDHAQFHLSLGGALLAQGDTDAARASFRSRACAGSESGRDPQPARHLALQAGEGSDAESRFRIGRRADEQDPLILYGLGNVYLDRREPANAAKFLSRAAELKPDDAGIQTSLGRAMFDQGAFGLAERAFENALRLRRIWAWRNSIWRGRACVRTSSKPRASCSPNWSTTMCSHCRRMPALAMSRASRAASCTH
jgi:predicted Zn-dependent protease